MRLLSLAILLGCFTTPLLANNYQSSLLAATQTQKNGAYTRTAFLALNKKPFDTNSSSRKLLIIGDSHAQDFLNGILENNYLSHYQIRTFYLPTRCQITFKAAARPYLNAEDQAFCEQANELAAAKPQIEAAEVIIIIARWRDWSARLWPSTLKQLNLKPHQQVIVLGARDFGKVVVQQYIHLPAQQLKTLTNKIDPVPIATNTPLSQGAETQHYTFIDQQSLICGSLTNCALFTPQGELISYDGGHLTRAGAKWVGQRLFHTAALNQLLKPPAFTISPSPTLDLALGFKIHF
ncbi:SGNH hydrolase domain-containing protein [Thiofilum flexile]|uniref:SGNH hydrolase domain-containing protein n=1 Tax=Thiofilum flexile TaxID=125627 RepID=UPI00037FE9F5|nr:SGNH hydrolase domain-containing protein [Thiofilum flexile]